MKTHTRVAVIGGGVVGASVLYHLARAGWTDVVLIERDELTSGSTWHAAGGMHTLNGDPNVAKLQKYTIELYREIEEASGQSCSIHITAGSLPDRLANLPHGRPIVTICASGMRASVAASILRSAGFEDVSWVASGVPAWRAAGHPVVRGDRPTREPRRAGTAVHPGGSTH